MTLVVLMYQVVHTAHGSIYDENGTCSRRQRRPRDSTFIMHTYLVTSTSHFRAVLESQLDSIQLIVRTT